MDSLDKLLKDVQESPKYASLSPDLIRRVGERELRHQATYKTALKATKNKLHQVAGAYFTNQMNYQQAWAQLEASQDLAETCQAIMMRHTSTHERLPILGELFQQALEDVPPIQRVLDIACGLNPLAIPWMPFGSQTEYLAYDVYADLTDFLTHAIPHLGLKGRGICTDVVGDIPSLPADLALILKTLPCLEQQDKQISLRLLDCLNTRYMLVSYPIQSLGGRDKGMMLYYETHLRSLLRDKPWQIKRYAFATELAFLITKN